MRKKHFQAGILVCLFFSFSAKGQFRFEEGKFWSAFTDTSKITFLQARLGSRFSFSLSTLHRGFYQGTIGMDNDNLSQWFCGFESDGKKLALPTGKPNSFSLFKNPEIGMHCLSTSMKGKSDDISLEWSQNSAWQSFENLEDTANLKLNTAPFYAWKLKVKNSGNSSKKVSLFLGQYSVPVDPDKGVNLSWWRLNQPCKRIYFRDPSGKNGLMALSIPEAQKALLFENQGFYGMKFELDLAPGEQQSIPLVWAGYQEDAVMLDEKHNQKLSFLYTRYLKNVDEVSNYGLKNWNLALSSGEKFENQVNTMPGSEMEKWLAALTFRTDLANGLLLKNEKGQPFWYETEGRFRHLNTLDVAFETQILARWMPWRLKMMLEQWAGYISLFEEKVPSTRTRAFIRENLEGVSSSETGAFVYHDLGNFPYVMHAEGYDFGPHLPVEENTNFIMLLYWHWKTSKDNSLIKKYAGLVAMLTQSLQNRDSNGNGLPDVGHGWSTYDVSEAIKRAPDNTYHGVKVAVAYMLAAEMLQNSVVQPVRSIDLELKTKDQDGNTLNGNQKAEWEKGTIGNQYLRERQIKFLQMEIGKILNALAKAQKKHGFIPVSLDEKFSGWNQQISVLGEGLMYPLLTDYQHPDLSRLIQIIKPEWEKSLKLCTKPYGLTISSAEPTTWFSKTMVMDYVATKAFGFKGSHAQYAYRWNLNNDQAYQDGAEDLKTPWPGNWYPRGLSAWLYLIR
jgi:hypothetical protein